MSTSGQKPWDYSHGGQAKPDPALLFKAVWLPQLGSIHISEHSLTSALLLIPRLDTQDMGKHAAIRDSRQSGGVRGHM